jgi:hypothetical protein
MKTKFGTSLALAAVLITGTAAAAINTQALVAPNKSNLGTSTTTLLPPVEPVVVKTAQPTNTLPGVAPAPNGQNPTSGATQPGFVTATPSPTASDTATTEPQPNPVYGNPNPSNGGDGGDDEYDNDDDQGHDNDGDDD